MLSTPTVANKQVLLYLPNIIIYIRIFLLLLAMMMCFKSPIATFSLYCLSAILDSLDGYLARKLQLTSKVGAIFDLGLDRITTVFAFMVVAAFYPAYWYIFCSLLMLDIASHFAYLHYCVLSKHDNHKTVETNNKFLKIYYTNRPFLFLCCLTHDMWLGVFYLYYFYPSKHIVMILILLFPGFFIKSLIHVVQLYSALKLSVQLDQV